MRFGPFPVRFLLLVLFGVYLCVWPGSTLLVALGRVPAWGVWMGSALLLLQGLLVGLWLCANYGRRGGLAALAILVISWAVEHVGATTGFPFGSYGYTSTLQPQIIGVVPLAIPFAWLLVVPAAVGVAEQLLAGRSTFANHPRRFFLLNMLLAACLTLLLDMTIEPVAVHVNDYWFWRDSGAYYGVPLSNFVGWWTTSAFLVGLTLLLIPSSLAKRTGRAVLLPWLPATLYVLNLLMFVLINLAYNQLLAGIIGVVVLAVLIVDRMRRRRLLFSM